jgi:hypothetical protein
MRTTDSSLPGTSETGRQAAAAAAYTRIYQQLRRIRHDL